MGKKLLIGMLIGGAIGAVALFAAKKEKNYISVNGEDSSEDEPKEDPTIKDKIRRAAEKVVAWIMEHKDYFEAASVVLSMVSACYSLKNEVLKGRKVVSKTPTVRDKRPNNEFLSGDEIIKRVKDTRRSVVATDDNGFNFIVMPEGGAA